MNYKDLHREYLFCKYLERLVPADPVTIIDITNKIKLEYYKLEKTFDGSMVKDDKLKTSARSNGEQMFSNNIMPKTFDDTLQKSYFENMEAYESWLKDKGEFMRKMMAEALYKAFLKD